MKRSTEGWSSGGFRTRACITLAVLGVIFLFKSLVASHMFVCSDSMYPSLFGGDLVAVNKLAYGLRYPLAPKAVLRWGEPQRGDVVVISCPDLTPDLTKRVVGMPGDTIRIVRSRLVINGTPVTYAPVAPGVVDYVPGYIRRLGLIRSERLAGSGHPMLLFPILRMERDYGPITIPPRHYFVMGDNRDFSMDSRRFGLVEEERIIGKVESIIASLDTDSAYRPRWGRFFKGIS